MKTGHHGLSKGFDGGKLIKGRKRHIIVDVMGLLLVIPIRVRKCNFDKVRNWNIRCLKNHAQSQSSFTTPLSRRSAEKDENCYQLSPTTEVVYYLQCFS
ncbi:hypothetical protein [Xenococcus sp. PCC 7305]|uniref:hypothetical protein n=1 Tax=Xenococcus sp. PCC 7305 TaxID=102125 RepID=UPI0035100B12